MSIVERALPPASSPRPVFSGPALIRRADVTRHIWGDPEAGEVFDWIYASTERVHMLVFGLAPGGAFRHSEAFRTIFAADEVLHVLQGTMVIADPETGEVQRVTTGESVFFRRDTWHHAFALGPEPLRVLHPADVLWRRDLGALCGILASTEHLTVASLELGPGDVARAHEHGGDEVLMVLEGALWVRAWHEGAVHVFELEPEDACYLPAGSAHEYRNARGGSARALCGIAPRYAP